MLKPKSVRFTPAGLLSVIAPFIAVFAVLFPEVRHYHVRAPAPAPENLALLRTGPADTVLAELGRMSYFTPRKFSEAEVLKMGGEFLEGRFDYPEFPGEPLKIPLEAAQVKALLPEFQLKLAGALIADILMDAFGISGDDKYLKAAHRHLAEMLKEDKRRIWPDGFLWNDHAIAGRIVVLARYWRLYRNHPSFDPEDATLILQGANRGALMLAKPGAFTFSTNHGVMQNLALLHYCAAFPGLDKAGSLRDTAVARLSAQMRFFVSDSGIVMEHSTGYHDFGLTLISMGMRYCQLLDIPIPPEWARKYAGMKRFRRLIARPDGTLPLYGDTELMRYPAPLVAELDSGKGPLRPLPPLPPSERHAVDPAAGYAVFWSAPGSVPGGSPGVPSAGRSAPLAQAFMAWPNFVSQAHKRADEMSLLFWANGADWWTAVGYMPYGSEHRVKAEGWEGSNAPHAVGERFGIGRMARLNRFTEDSGSYYLDVDRRTVDGYRARRQLLHLKPGVWLVIDAVSDSLNRNSHVIWNLPPSVRIVPRGDRAYALSDSGSGAKMDVAMDVLPSPASPEPAPPRIVNGSVAPFAGWIAKEKAVWKTDALLFELASGSQAAMAWALDSLGKTLASADLSEYRADGSWKARIAIAGDTIALACDATALEIAPANGKSGVVRRILDLQPAPSPERRYGEMTRAFLDLSGKYQRYRESFAPYRLKWFYIILGLFLFQELIFLGMRAFPPAAALALRYVSLVFWTGLALWLSLVYFGP